VRVLFTAYAGYGHVAPMLAVARALLTEGHDVLFAVSEDLCPAVASDGIPVASAGLRDVDVVGAARARWPEAASAPARTWTPRMFAEIAAPAMARDLEPLVAAWCPDVIVREQGEQSAPVVATRAQIPWVTHGWGAPLPDREALEELRGTVQPLWEDAGLSVPEGTGLYGAGVLDPCPPSLYVEDPCVDGRRAVRVTPVADAVGERQPRSIRHAYVGFGTVPLFRHPRTVLVAVVAALLDVGFRVTVTVDDDGVARELRGLGSAVRVTQWIDLASVLCSTDLVVCHGGAGTTLAALAAGLPLVLVPQGAPSQERMAVACERRGVGRVGDFSDLADLRKAVHEVAVDDRFAVEAAAVATEIACMPEPSMAAGVLTSAMTA